MPSPNIVSPTGRPAFSNSNIQFQISSQLPTSSASLSRPNQPNTLQSSPNTSTATPAGLGSLLAILAQHSKNKQLQQLLSSVNSVNSDQSSQLRVQKVNSTQLTQLETKDGNMIMLDGNTMVKMVNGNGNGSVASLDRMQRGDSLNEQRSREDNGMTQQSPQNSSQLQSQGSREWDRQLQVQTSDGYQITQIQQPAGQNVINRNFEKSGVPPPNRTISMNNLSDNNSRVQQQVFSPPMSPRQSAIISSNISPRGATQLPHLSTQMSPVPQRSPQQSPQMTAANISAALFHHPGDEVDDSFNSSLIRDSTLLHGINRVFLGIDNSCEAYGCKEGRSEGIDDHTVLISTSPDNFSAEVSHRYWHGFHPSVNHIEMTGERQEIITNVLEAFNNLKGTYVTNEPDYLQAGQKKPQADQMEHWHHIQRRIARHVVAGQRFCRNIPGYFR